ncbi:MAG: DUF2628 domain-containing protein [Eggerthellaceae bacterium]|jgi:hypothetical protein|nr:DUF2628 domain-containing protein [Eggerthellaceae bacterium]
MEEKDMLTQEKAAPEPVKQGVAPEANTGSQSAYEPYLEAFIEGSADSAVSASEKTAQMLAKMTASSSFSWCTLILAPIYWGWRRCYKEAAAYVGCILTVWLLAILPGLGLLMTVLQIGAGFAFYPLYRKRAMRVYRDAYMTHGADREAMMAAMRNAGGTSWKGLWLTMACYFAAVCAVMPIGFAVAQALYGM